MTVYCMVQVNVHNAEEYAKYAALAGPAAEKYGGYFLARAGHCVHKEGAPYARNVIIRFSDFEAAEKFYHSPEYQGALEFALAEGVSSRLYTIVEGVDG